MIIHDIYTLTDSAPIELKRNEEATVNLELSKVPPCYDTILIGKVVDRDCPIFNATVIVFDKDLNPQFHTNTDKNGFFEFKNLLSSGEYKIIASADYYTTSNIKLVTINDRLPTKIIMRLQKSSSLSNGTLYGKILEEGTNAPVKGASIYVKPLDCSSKILYKTTSNSNGQYLVYNIFPNKYIVEAEKDGYISSKPVESIIDKHCYTQLNFYFTENYKDNRGIISGVITSNKTPVINAQVFLYSLDNKVNERILHSQLTNEQGIYLFSNLENGCYVVKVKLQDGEWFEKNVELCE